MLPLFFFYYPSFQCRTGGGYGICGHKNVYNAKVKEGNWIEDKYGVDMAKTRATNIARQTVESEHNANFKAPSAEFLRELSANKVATATELERAVLFNHGPNIFEVDTIPYTAAGRDIMRERARKLKEENDMVRVTLS
jgi:hypothetical protein